MKKDIPGTEFPYSALQPGGPTMYADSKGMTLRDYFAAKALPSVIVEPTTESAAQQIQEDTGEEVCYFQVCATIAYGFADAMLKAREK